MYVMEYYSSIFTGFQSSDQLETLHMCQRSMTKQKFENSFPLFITDFEKTVKDYSTSFIEFIMLLFKLYLLYNT